MPSQPGLSLIALAFDEAAFINGGGSTDDCAEIIAAAPALTQFEHEAITILASSPATQTGQFFESHQECCVVDTTGKAINPDTVMIHAASWDLYAGWEHAHLRSMYPGGPSYPQFHRAIVTPTSPEVAATRRNDDVRYRVEFLAKWAAVLNPFFTRAAMAEHLRPVPRNPARAALAGRHALRLLRRRERSVTGANTALVVAHLETHDGELHLVFDAVHVWRPPTTRIVTSTTTTSSTPSSPSTTSSHRFADRRFVFRARHPAMAQRTSRGTRPGSPASKQSPPTSPKFARYDLFRTLATNGYIHAPQPRPRQSRYSPASDRRHPNQCPTHRPNHD